MKNLFLVLCLSSATFLSAQTSSEMTTQPERQKEQLAFQNADEIAETLEISLDEAKLVWDKYAEYHGAKEGMKGKNRELMLGMRKGQEKMSDAEYERAYRGRLENQREKINLDENYYNQFLEILPASKVHTLLMADRKNKSEMREHKGQPEQQRTRIRR